MGVEGGKCQELSSQKQVVERAVQGARAAAQPATERRACAKKSDRRRWPRFQKTSETRGSRPFLAEGFPHGRRRLADAGGSRMFCRRWDPCVEPLGRISCFASTGGLGAVVLSNRGGLEAGRAGQRPTGKSQGRISKPNCLLTVLLHEKKGFLAIETDLPTPVGNPLIRRSTASRGRAGSSWPPRHSFGQRP